MAITNTRELETITTLKSGEIECKFVDRIRDGEETLSSKNHYEVFAVGADLSVWDARIQAIAAAVWTPESMAAMTLEIVTRAVAETAERQAALDEALAKSAQAQVAIEQAHELKTQADATIAAAQQAKTQADAIAAGSVVDDLQIRLALTETGLRASLEAAVAAADQDTQDWYARAKRFVRTDQRVLTMAAALGVSDAGLDALWALAATK